mmetsp:Transcript_5116/g.7115  ORF Transcript_5116/g.7115 Transcript_5116/m.7115 type:complete len:211 (+) Transcript_5116:1242-1874(+)
MLQRSHVVLPKPSIALVLFEETQGGDFAQGCGPQLRAHRAESPQRMRGQPTGHRRLHCCAASTPALLAGHPHLLPVHPAVPLGQFLHPLRPRCVVPHSSVDLQDGTGGRGRMPPMQLGPEHSKSGLGAIGVRPGPVACGRGVGRLETFRAVMCQRGQPRGIFPVALLEAVREDLAAALVPVEMIPTNASDTAAAVALDQLQAAGRTGEQV